MAERHLESIPYEGLQNGTHLDVEVYYSKGGMNYWSGGSTPRGYYVSVKPVTRRGDGMVSHMLFAGKAQFLMQTKRFSEKQFRAAIEMSKDVTPGLIELVLKEERAA